MTPLAALPRFLRPYVPQQSQSEQFARRAMIELRDTRDEFNGTRWADAQVTLSFDLPREAFARACERLHSPAGPAVRLR